MANSSYSDFSYYPTDALLPQAIPFKALDAGDIVVHAETDTTQQLLALDTHYAIDGDLRAGTATITALVEYDAGVRFHVRRATEQTQPEVFPPHTPFPAASAELGLDRLSMQIQEVDDALASLESRAVRVAEPEVLAALPRPDSRKGKLLTFNTLTGALELLPPAEVLADFVVLDQVAVEDGALFSSRAVMSAVAAPVNGQVGYLHEAGREGWFRFSTADLSAQVAADLEEAIYVAPDADSDGSSGAWVRIYRGFAAPEMMGTVTAGGLEGMAALVKGIECEPGAAYEILDVCYLTGDNLVLRGNGATIRNVTAGPLVIDDPTQRTLALGTSHPASNALLTYHPITSAAGAEVILTSGESNFTAGDMLVFRGASKYTTGGSLDHPRWMWRTRLLSRTGTTLVVEDALPPELIADTPEVATCAEGLALATDGGRDYYLLYRPKIHDLRVESETGNLTLYRGGVVHGLLDGISSDGHSGLGINALQFCEVRNLDFRARRRGIELSDACWGTHVHHVRGTMYDDGTAPDFIVAIGENGHYNTLSDAVIDASAVDPTGNGVMLAPGSHNRIHHCVFDLSGQTGATAVTFVTGDYGNGGAVEDCEFIDNTVHCGSPNYMLQFAPATTGYIRRCVARGNVFTGTAAVGAVLIDGDDNVVVGNRFDDGACIIDTGCAGATITGNHFPDGLLNPTIAMFENNEIRDNTSDRSERVKALAVINETGDNITSTTANELLEQVTFAPGDLAGLDKVLFEIPGQIWGGTATRHIRVTANIDGATDVELIDWTESTHATPFTMRGELHFNSATNMDYRVEVIVDAKVSIVSEGTITGNVTTNGLDLVFEAWNSTTGGYIIIRAIRIAARIPGFVNAKVAGW